MFHSSMKEESHVGVEYDGGLRERRQIIDRGERGEEESREPLTVLLSSSSSVVKAGACAGVGPLKKWVLVRRVKQKKYELALFDDKPICV